ncbi:MAG: acyl-CoA dehydrogenase [Alphaproteobacteria bacterium]|nr:acyl-CoA dehydrogenase [Alphaproteobacteria bacterium]
MASPGPSFAELVARAEALVPVLAERAPKAEALRHIPDETVADLHRTGLFRAFQPKGVGGSELDYGAFVDLCSILGRACGSTSWVYANLAVHHLMIGMWPAKAQDEIWGPSPDTLVGSSLVFPAGRAQRVEGGYRVSGRWPFSSGVDPCTWLMVGAMVAPDGKKSTPEARMFLVPQPEYGVIDTWHVAGLRGTGSKDVEVKDVFVPEHRTLAMDDTKGGPTPGSARNPGVLFRLPLMALFQYCITSPILGMAQGAVQGFIAKTRTRAASYTGAKVAELATIQVRLAEAAALVDSAELLMRNACAEAHRITEAGGVPTMEQKVRYRRDAAFSVQQCVRAVDLIMEVYGGGGLYDHQPIQRAWRDVHAGAAHISFAFDAVGATYGKVMLGLGVDNPLL